MADASHLGTQFHEMTREEFETQPNLWWHGSTTGIIGHQGSSFHVGTRAAANEALGARIGFADVYNETNHSRGTRKLAEHPTAQMHAGHIVAPMANTPHVDPSRGPGDRWSYREGIPWGSMEDWSRRNPSEVMSDVRANAVERGLRTRGQQMRRGIYYVNASEGLHSPEEGSHVPVSAIIPNRSGFRTHEDYVLRAKAAGKKVPSHVLDEYPHLGQGRLL